MLNQYYNAEINILLCRCRMVSVSHDWRKSIFLPVDFWRLYYHHDSYVDILFENTPARIPSGQLILIPPNTKLSHEMKHDFKQFYIHFLAAAPYDHCRAGIYPIETDAATSRLLDGLMAEAEEKEVRAPSRVFSIRLEALCGLALSRFPEDAVLQNHANKQIETVIHHIDRFLWRKTVQPETGPRQRNGPQFLYSAFPFENRRCTAALSPGKTGSAGGCSASLRMRPASPMVRRKRDFLSGNLPKR